MSASGRNRGGPSHDRQWTHRQALQVLATLPDDQQAALAILDRAKLLLTRWDFGEVLGDSVRELRPRLVKSD